MIRTRNAPRERSARREALLVFLVVALCFFAVPLVALAQPAGTIRLLPGASELVPVPEGQLWRVYAPQRASCADALEWVDFGIVAHPDSAYVGLGGCDNGGEWVFPPDMAGIAVAVSYISPDPPGPPASAPEFSWGNPAHLLQLFLWAGVPLVGFWGYSMGARE